MSVNGPTVAHVPRPLLLVAWAVLLTCAAMTLLGAVRVGVSTDEAFHVQRFNNYLETGWYLADDQLDPGERPVAGETDQYVYGPATTLLLHGIAAMARVEPWDRMSRTALAYDVRHLGVAFIGLVGVAAVVAIARVLLRRWDWGVVAGAMLVAVPMWTGYAMYNLKDVPVGTGYALATLGLVLIARWNTYQATSLRFASLAVAIAGAVLAVGTRPAMWAGLAAGALVTIVAPALDRSRQDSLRHLLVRVQDLLIVAVASWAVLWIMNPNVFSRPLDLLKRSVGSSSEYKGLSSPWQSVPLWASLQVPLVEFGLFGLGCGLVGWRVLRGRLRLDPFDSSALIVAAQALAMPLGVMVTKSPIFGSIRQLLFAAPAAAVLATVGLAGVCSWTAESRLGVKLPAVCGLASLGLLVPLVAQAMLFPYNYVFHNPLANAVGVDVNGGDYYHLAQRDLAPKVPAVGRLVCLPDAAVPGRNYEKPPFVATRIGHLTGWTDCRKSDLSPVSPYSGQFSPRREQLDPDEFWAITEWGTVGTNCRREAGISRRTPWQEVEMATLSRCRLPFPTLPETSTFAAGQTLALRVPDRGWNPPSDDPDQVGIASSGSRATMTFKLPESLLGRSVTLFVETTTASRPSVRFAGRAIPTTVSESPAGFSVTIPEDLVRRSAEQPATLAFSSARGTPLNLTVLGLRLVPATS